jgi:hypothetical protein
MLFLWRRSDDSEPAKGALGARAQANGAEPPLVEPRVPKAASGRE